MNSATNDKPVAVVLGGTFPHIMLVRNLQGRGYFTVLIDYYENPPAKAAADEHVRASTLDIDSVLEIALNWKAKLVISTCIDQANVTACYVAEKLGLPAPYSYETALTVTNKVLMKEIMTQSGISTAKHISVRNMSGFDGSKLEFPVVVKPADSNSSKGVRKACNLDELNRFLQDALTISRNREAVIEEYKEGREIGVDCFIQDREVTVLMTKERRKVDIPVGGDPIQQIYGCIWPAELSPKIHTALKEIATKIAEAFDLNNTPLMMQVIVNEFDINIIEFGVRIGGGESFRIINLLTGFDYIDAAVNSFLGVPVDLHCKVPETFFAENFIYSKAGLFGRIGRYETLVQNGIIEYIDSYRTEGQMIGSELSSNNRVGVFAVKSSTVNGLFEKLNLAIKQIEVYDLGGKPMMRKDIYSSYDRDQDECFG